MTQKQYRIRKGFGEWSSGTVVHLIREEKNGATVRHIPTGRTFWVPRVYLVEKRNRSERRDNQENT